MTKIYLKPETVIVKIEQQQPMLQSSETIDKSNDEVNDTGGLLGRGFSFFEDEDIEEEY